jgi:pimeloyl-ACP methyl ester carboxylesterase
MKVLGLEVLDLPATRPDRPEILMLHEGLGSVSMWRDFPQRLSQATGSRVIAYSRRGFGRSEPRTQPYGLRFMHEEALETIPALREKLDIVRPLLFGHSTGASMALIHAGADRWPVAGVVALAPITYVEPSNLGSIQQAREIWRTTDWRAKLGKHHDDVDMAWSAWNDTWLDPAFAAWTIESDLQGIRVPLVMILGTDDPYSTPAQLEYVRRHARSAASIETVLLEDCGHAPHRDRPESVLAAVGRLLEAV